MITTALAQLLQTAEHDDSIEDRAADFLGSRGIPLASHSRDNIIHQALSSGWLPYPAWNPNRILYLAEQTPPAAALASAHR